MIFIEDNDILNADEQVGIQSMIVESTTFPWYRMPESSSEAYPFYGHLLATRNDLDETVPSSEYFWDFADILDRFIQKHNLLQDGYTIMRSALNDSLSFTDQHCDPHVDHLYPHMVFILYLTNASGETIIYEDVYDGENQTHLNTDNPDMTIAKLSPPSINKMIAFDGMHYHAFNFKKPEERRVICVWTVKPK